MKRLLLLFVFVASPVFAQDDCPSGHVKHPAVSPLDHDYMLRAFQASHRGIFGVESACTPGSGVHDCEYYISASNHYGVYGDDQCHAGWSGYWESWLSVGRGDLALVQTPARFLPSSAPPMPVPTPTPVPVPPPPNVDALADQLRSTYMALMNQSQANREAILAAVAGVKQDVAEFREAMRSKWEAIVKSPYFQVIAGAVVTWATTYKLTRP